MACLVHKPYSTRNTYSVFSAEQWDRLNASTRASVVTPSGSALFDVCSRGKMSTLRLHRGQRHVCSGSELLASKDRIRSPQFLSWSAVRVGNFSWLSQPGWLWLHEIDSTMLPSKSKNAWVLLVTFYSLWSPSLIGQAMASFWRGEVVVLFFLEISFAQKSTLNFLYIFKISLGDSPACADLNCP